MKRRVHLTAGQWIALGVFFCAVLLRHLEIKNIIPGFLAANLRSVMLIALYAAWGISLRQRLVSGPIRRYLSISANLIVFWILIRTVKYQYLVRNSAFGRYIWYLYYLPLLFLPLLTLLVSECIWKPEGFRLPERYRVLIAIPAALLLAILTNDVHQLAFAFPSGPAQSQTVYTHGIVYWLAAAWIVIVELIGLLKLIRKSKVPGSGVIWQPLAVLAAAVLYAALILYPNPQIRSIVLPLPDSMCFFTVAIWETCILCHLIPSNTEYGALFNASTLSAQIMDRRYQVRYASENAPEVSGKMAAQAALEPVRLDADHLLKSGTISGGQVLYVADVSAINAKLQDLRETGGELAGRNELLQAEIRQKQKLVQVSEQNRLYDKMSEIAAPQITRIRRLLQEDSAQNRAAKLGEICVIGSYVKRRSNLSLIAEKERTAPAEELERCLRESIENLRLCGIHCFFDRRLAGDLPIQDIEQIYELFEAAAEEALSCSHSLLVNLQVLDGSADLKIQYEAPQKSALPSILKNCSTKRFRARAEQEDSTVYVFLQLSGGQDA